MKDKIGISLIPLKNSNLTLKYAIRAYREDIKLITISDYHKAGSFYLAMIKILEKVKNVNIGTAVTNTLIHSPWELANFFVSLKKTYNENIFLGIGTGDWYLFKMFNIDSKTAIDNLIRGIKIIKRIFEKEKVKIPIYMGAQGEYMLKISTRICDGVIINLANEEDLKKAIELIKDKSKTIFAISQTYVYEDEEKAIQEARKSATIIYAGMSDSSIKLYGYDAKIRDNLRKLILENRIKEARELLKDKDVKRLTICGNYKEVKERINRLLELKIDKLILGLPMDKEQKRVLENIIKILK
jgi:alkanesulfonate monooxygenase SsuD/methylene tetrahydromethanopterin reductase-like flavin-dependent oxidoreductase (luciferase family)